MLQDAFFFAEKLHKNATRFGSYLIINDQSRFTPSPYISSLSPINLRGEQQSTSMAYWETYEWIGPFLSLPCLPDAPLQALSLESARAR